MQVFPHFCYAKMVYIIVFFILRQKVTHPDTYQSRFGTNDLVRCGILAACHRSAQRDALLPKNHPRGRVTPSRADDELTQTIQKACQVISVD